MFQFRKFFNGDACLQCFVLGVDFNVETRIESGLNIRKNVIKRFAAFDENLFAYDL